MMLTACLLSSGEITPIVDNEATLPDSESDGELANYLVNARYLTGFTKALPDLFGMPSMNIMKFY